MPTLIVAGRTLQLVAGIALVIGWQERIAALLFALFLIPATLTEHDFWAPHGPEQQGQIVTFLKNVAIFGGLCFVAFRLPTAAGGAHSDNGGNALVADLTEARRDPAATRSAVPNPR